MMQMKLFILTSSILLCLPDSTLALRWLSTPGEMLACTGDNVTFHWEYDTQDERVRTVINIINAQTERTFLTYYVDNGHSKEIPEYKGRTEFIEHSQESTKFILKNVTKMDSIGYILQLGGLVDAKKFANLKVYDRPELKPTLHMNNKPHEFNQPLNLISNEVPTMTLLTAQSVPANISISVDGDIVITCTRSIACVHSLSDTKVGDIGFEVDYGVCGVITEELAVVSDEETPSVISSKVENIGAWTTEQSDEMTTFAAELRGKSNQATVVVSVIVTFAVIILILLLIRILYILWYRARSRSGDPPPSGPTESKLFMIFPICCCKKQCATSPKSDRSDDNDDHKNTFLLSNGQVNEEKEGEEACVTQLTPTAHQDTNSSAPNLHEEQEHHGLSTKGYPPSSGFHPAPREPSAPPYDFQPGPAPYPGSYPVPPPGQPGAYPGGAAPAYPAPGAYPGGAAPAYVGRPYAWPGGTVPGNAAVVGVYVPGKPNQLWAQSGDHVVNQNDGTKVLQVDDLNPGSGVTVAMPVSDQRQLWCSPGPGVAPVAPIAPVSSVQPGLSSRRYFFIRSDLHGKVMDVQGGNHSQGTAVIMYPRKPGQPAANQLWYQDEQGCIRSRLNDFALQPTANDIRLQPFNGSPNQRWVIQGKKIVNEIQPNLCMDIIGQNREDGARLCQYAYKATPNQHWNFDYV